MRTLGWLVFGVLSCAIGVYPLMYFLAYGPEQGLLANKSTEIQSIAIYAWSFYVHIIFGGVSLLVGWVQFSKKVRSKYLSWHRGIGKIYVLSVLLSGLSGFYIAQYADGGIIAIVGFSGLALAWLYTTGSAYVTIRNKNIVEHEKWMIRSYTLCWAAVTLRLYIPLFTEMLGMDFLPAYVIIAWLCWVPNLIGAEIYIRYSPSK
jgi:uncharacterized membrane protein